MSEQHTADLLAGKSPIERLVIRLTNLPRLARIAFAALFAVATTLLLTPLIDGIYVQRFFDFNTRMLPALVSTVIGIAVYFIGWVVYVGYVGESVQARRAVFWYFFYGTLVMIAIVLLIITGALDLTR